MERRRVDRKRLRLRVRMEPGALTAITEDVSSTGLFLRSARVFQAGTPVELTIFLPDGSVEANGVIRWARRVPVQLVRDIRGGMGIELSHAPTELRTYLTAPPA